MCGIVGIWSTYGQEVQERYVDDILKLQQHRGPDFTGRTTIDSVTLGHNRLAIIDLHVNAHQPFFSSCGRYGIVFNGEIYNYIELKKELDYPFSTSSDTEVLLACFIAYGEQCLEKLNGMFAFAIYDKQERALFCARDRIGEKPFVYTSDAQGFYFASELAALFSLGIFSDACDEIGIAYSYLRNFRHIPEPYTRYKAIKRLEPAHAMWIKDRRIVKKWCYWSLNMEPKQAITPQQIRWLVDDAIRLRERSDVEVAALLSGGVDSSIIVGAMVKHGLCPKAFTLKADDEECQRAKEVADLFGVKLKIFDYDKNLQETLHARMTDIYGEEVRLLPLTHAARLYHQISQENIKVVMSGIGADELFYGYDGANKQQLFSDIVRCLEILPSKLLHTFEKIFPKNSDARVLFELAQQTNEKRKGYLYAQEAKEKGLPENIFNTLIDFWADKVCTQSYIDMSHWIGLMCENAHSITISSDLPAMMFGIECRAPFLDHRVVEMAFAIESHRKIGRLDGRANNKLILKKAFEDLLPQKILYAPKKGFGYGLQHD